MPHGDAEAQLLSHVSTPAKFREALQLFCGVHVPDVLLKATEVRVTSCRKGYRQQAKLHAAISLVCTTKPMQDR